MSANSTAPAPFADEKPSVADDKTAVSPSPSSEIDPEKQQQDPPPPRRRWWLDDVNPRRGDLALLACCFVTGLLDTSAFHNWGTFVGMQTGNTVILCLSSAGYPTGQKYAWATTLIALVSFFLGSFTTSRLSRFMGPRRRVTVCGNFLAQSLLIVVAAALATGNVLLTDHNDSPEAVLQDPRILIAIGPLAFQSGCTMALSGLLGHAGSLPIIVYTSTYNALASDTKLFQIHKNHDRNRRVLAVVCILSGAMVATWLEKKSIGMVAVFWMAGGIKLVITVAIALLLPAKAAAAGKS